MAETYKEGMYVKQLDQAFLENFFKTHVYLGGDEVLSLQSSKAESGLVVRVTISSMLDGERVVLRDDFAVGDFDIDAYDFYDSVLDMRTLWRKAMYEKFGEPYAVAFLFSGATLW